MHILESGKKINESRRIDANTYIQLDAKSSNLTPVKFCF